MQMVAWQSPDPVALHAARKPDGLACVDLASGRRWTYRALDAAIQGVLGRLRDDYGLGRGQRLAALAKNSVDLFILQQAAARGGLIFVPINWRLSIAELLPILEDCEPSLLVEDGSVPGPLALPAGCRRVDVGSFAETAPSSRTAEQAERPSIHDPSIILYTSGTSGRPKGVVLTEANACATAVNFGVIGDVTPESVFLCDAPMFHVIGLITSIRAPLFKGGIVLISSGFDPAKTNDRLADRSLGVTHYFCVPQMADALAAQPNFHPEHWHNLVALFTGGAPHPPARIRWWLERGVTVVDGFGMTEAGTVLGMPISREIVAAKAGSAGLPAPLVSMRIVDDEGENAVPGAAGEILLAGPNITRHYWRKPNETAEAFTPDGWFKTGDIGRRDEDGFVTIVDRRKDMFISGGENVYSVEVEAVLAEHPDIREVAVVGIPDAKWGEVGRAFIVLTATARLDVERLAAHCAARLARYKIPKEFVPIDRLPRTAGGKIMKHKLRDDGAHRPAVG